MFGVAVGTLQQLQDRGSGSKTVLYSEKIDSELSQYTTAEVLFTGIPAGQCAAPEL
jgi:hypothetical protein